MKILQRALIVGGSSDHLNSNSILRQFVAEGMQTAFPDATVIECGADRAYEVARDFRPELVVIFGSVMLDDVDHLPLVEVARRQGARIVFWLHDDPYEFDSSYRVLPLADVVFTNEIACLDFYPSSIEVHHLPLGASSTRHYRPIAARPGPDLFFCGHMYPNRQKILTDLQVNNRIRQNKIVFCGSSDNHILSKYWTSLRLSNESLADFNATSLSVLNIGREFDLANSRFNVRAATPGPRTFEAAMAGAAQIVCGSGHEIEAFFEPESEFLLASTSDQIGEHLERLRREPSISLKLGAAAQKRAQRDHTYSARARTLVSLV